MPEVIDLPPTERRLERPVGVRRPTAPRVTRLNRNALLAAALLGAATILVVGVVVSGDNNVPVNQTAAVRRSSDNAARPSYLEPDPFRNGGSSRDVPIVVPPPAYGPSGAPGAPGTMGATVYPSGVVPPGYDPLAGGAAGFDAGAPAPAAYTPGSTSTAPDPRAEAFRRALNSGMVSGGPRGPSLTSNGVPAAVQTLPDLQRLAEEMVRASAGQATASGSPGQTEHASGPQPGAALPFPAAGTDGSTPQTPGAGSPREQPFLASQRNAGVNSHSATMQPVATGWVLHAGTMLPAMLITGVNSDLPGEIIAQVSRNVYDSGQRVVLIPRGSRLIGRYDSQVALGQNRLLVAWTRLILPDGRSLALPGLGSKDTQGASGIQYRTNNHYRRVYGNALLLSIIGAGAQLSQPRQDAGPYGYGAPSVAQVGAAAVGQQLSSVALEVIRRNMEIRPTVEIRQGMPFNVFLTTDLTLPAYTDH
ncbi:hypothetical protein BH20GEM3_BH20GEM3_06620 [soil metagenome]